MDKREQIIQRITNLTAEQFAQFMNLYSQYEQLSEEHKQVTNGFVKRLAENNRKTA